jgi:hypothetical protein
MNNQISFITAFKKFKPPYGMIQHSALYSWHANDIKIVAPENEVGLKESCSGYKNLILFPGVKRARELGFQNQSPIVKDLIDKALPYVETPMIGLINSDIIIPEDFSSLTERIFKKYGFNIFLVTSRQDIQLNYSVNSLESYTAVQKELKQFYDTLTSSDLFITSKFWWRKIVSVMPEFILGRYAWDNWLHMYAEMNMNNDKYNASKIINILHCKHSHDHIFVQEKARDQQAPSSQYNIKLWEQARGTYGTPIISAWKEIQL